MISFFHRLKEMNRLYILIIFSLTTILCVTLVAFRVQYTSKVTFVFLVWNIFLALVPYMISTLLVLYHHTIKQAAWLWIPFMVWLCFFPNAPYILTDLFHLKQRPGVPYWYDLALILFFAWNGLMLGFASMMDIQAVFTARFKPWIGWTISIGSLLLGGFGIYLGRYLRWNSWDVISSPMQLLHDIATRILNPFQHPQTYGVTILFSTFLLLGYILLMQFSKVYTRK
ncbi:MAG TPA: DUF1361 domain-containing protein [Ohtaekwangia sp.]|uniref:DUF1361 domain-containing protein n=1 Tax=Ohtaekwangia sp. TaxID=2066019 RepID=UPI002F942CAF